MPRTALMQDSNPRSETISTTIINNELQSRQPAAALETEKLRVSPYDRRHDLDALRAIAMRLGIADGLSAISANKYIEKGLTNLALARFVEELNNAVFLFVAIGIPTAFILYLLYRIAPRSFRWIASILFFLALAAAAMRVPLFVGRTPAALSFDLPFFLGAGRAALVLLACVAGARIFYEAIPLFSALLRGFTLRFVVGILFLRAAANSDPGADGWEAMSRTWAPV